MAWNGKVRSLGPRPRFMKFFQVPPRYLLADDELLDAMRRTFDTQSGQAILWGLTGNTRSLCKIGHPSGLLHQHIGLAQRRESLIGFIPLPGHLPVFFPK